MDLLDLNGALNESAQDALRSILLESLVPAGVALAREWGRMLKGRLLVDLLGYHTRRGLGDDIFDLLLTSNDLFDVASERRLVRLRVDLNLNRESFN